LGILGTEVDDQNNISGFAHGRRFYRDDANELAPFILEISNVVILEIPSTLILEIPSTFWRGS